jgi:hypothetical protein
VLGRSLHSSMSRQEHNDARPPVTFHRRARARAAVTSGSTSVGASVTAGPAQPAFRQAGRLQVGGPRRARAREAPLVADSAELLIWAQGKVGEMLGPTSQGKRHDLEPFPDGKSWPPVIRHRYRDMARIKTDELRAYLTSAREKYLANDGRIAASRTQRHPALDRLRALARQDGGKSAQKHIIICALLHAYSASKNKQ